MSFLSEENLFSSIFSSDFKMKLEPLSRNAFAAFVDMPTRWADNDLYGHVNNVTYFSYFDTAVNQWLIEQGLLCLSASGAQGNVNTPLGLVVSNQCQFYASVAFPQCLEIGLCVEHLGRSSVRYGLGVFVKDTRTLAAYGQFTHVYVQRSTRKPILLPEQWRVKLSQLVVLK
jgi:acyl-CoA thioester hydrolase